MNQATAAGWQGALIISWLCVVLGVPGEAESATFAERFRKFVLGPDAQGSSLPSGEVKPDLDEVAAGCMKCHDGSKGAHVTVKGTEQGMQFRGAQSINHPVGMDYGEATSKRPHEFHSRGGLGTQIRLVNGKVSCVSCHRLKADLSPAEAQKDPENSASNNCLSSGQLASGPNGRNLCQTCHFK